MQLGEHMVNKRYIYIRAVPEGFLEDMNDSFYKLSQLLERDDGNPKDVTENAYQQFVPLLIEK